MSPLAADKRDRRVIIQTPVVTKNNSGGFINTPQTFKTVWARKIPINTGEKYVAASQRGVELVDWEINYLSGVTNKMQLNYSGSVYKILAVIEIGRKEGWRLETERIINAT